MSRPTIAEAAAEVERLKAKGWTREDFAAALEHMFESEDPELDDETLNAWLDERRSVIAACPDCGDGAVLSNTCDDCDTRHCQTCEPCDDEPFDVEP